MQLHDRERHLANVVERGALPEVLERQAHADLGQGASMALGMLAAALAQLQRQRGRVEVGPLQHRVDVAQQAGVAELTRRDVDVDPERLHAGEAEVPRAQLARGSVEHALTDGHDEPGLLGQWQVLGGGDGAHEGMPPAQEGLDRRDGPRAQVDDGLVLESELVAFDGPLELLGEIDRWTLRPLAFRHVWHA